jgi:hypothetical protein
MLRHALMENLRWAGRQNVEVTSETPELKTDRADVATTFNEKYVEEIPILNRNFTTLQLMAPVRKRLWAGATRLQKIRKAATNLYSGTAFQRTAYELDGTDNQDPILGIIVVNPNLDAVTEAKVRCKITTPSSAKRYPAL